MYPPCQYFLILLIIHHFDRDVVTLKGLNHFDLLSLTRFTRSFHSIPPEKSEKPLAF